MCLVHAALRNIELKARCVDLDAAAKAVAGLTPAPRESGTLDQIDTYFCCARGRLKLREIVGIKSELIWYDRSDVAESRKSDYRLVDVPDPAALRVALGAGLGVRGTVSKRRRLLMWHNVRIHLDQVEGLGSFVEFEAVITPGESEAVGHKRLAVLCRTMAITPADYCDASYADLLTLPG
jgi:adenylate cyclase class IV